MVIRNVANSLSPAQKRRIKKSIAIGRGYYHTLVSRLYGYDAFIDFLRTRLSLADGDTILVHSSFDALRYWNIDAFRVIAALKSVLGSTGTIMVPTFPTTDTEKYLEKKRIFNVHRTPSVSGLLTELLRREKGALRSFDPIRPFAATGENAEYLLSEHHLSRSSFDEKSPLYKLAELGGKVIGLGAPLHNMTLVHTLESIMGDRFPIAVLHDEPVTLEVINGKESLQITKYILLGKIANSRNIEKFCSSLSDDVVSSFKNHFSSYFLCDAKKFLTQGEVLVEKGLTIYGN